MIKVLIVDDSAFARKVLRETLSAASGFQVVAYARDGLEALELISLHDPDVITLDLMMPNLDGLGLLRELALRKSKLEVVVVSTSGANTALGLEALDLGAFDVVQKPSPMPSPLLYDMGDTLKRTVEAAGQRARSPRPSSFRRESTSPPIEKSEVILPSLSTHRSIVVIGTSTGGPPALTKLVKQLPANFPVPIAVALHIPAGYTESLAERLDAHSALRVVEAQDGMELTAGMMAIAQGGSHLRIKRQGERFFAQISDYPVASLYKPSIDVLFESIVAEGPRAIAVVLTGMGDDGVIGARALSAAGGTILIEAESSCVVYGMPRAVADAGIVHAQADIEAIPALILKHTVRGHHE